MALGGFTTLAAVVVLVAAADTAPRRGLTAAPLVARAYDTILDADFDRASGELAAICGPAPRAACLLLESLALWWRIQLDPESRALDPAFRAATMRAIAEADAWSRSEPERAEAWFYVGAAYGARAQWRVLRLERLAAARDGKRIKQALERALALDPDLDDARFGLGLYRYYADIAPGVVKFLRWLLLLPGGNRAEGLAQIERAREGGQLVAGEAAYQLHVLYLWYEDRWPEALRLVLDLQARYPRNPLFVQIEAEIRDVYFHDRAGSLAASERLLALATARQVHRAEIAEVRARLNMAVQLAALGERTRALAEVDRIIASRPSAPAGALERAHELRRRLTRAEEGESRRPGDAYSPTRDEPTHLLTDVSGWAAPGARLTTANALCLTTRISHP